MTDHAGLLRLYVSGSGPRAEAAIASATALCRDVVPEAYALEIVDVAERPEMADAAGVVLTPTLVRVRPAPSLRWVGDLVDTERLAEAFQAPGA